MIRTAKTRRPCWAASGSQELADLPAAPRQFAFLPQTDARDALSSSLACMPLWERGRLTVLTAAGQNEARFATLSKRDLPQVSHFAQRVAD
jgi:hypothetical protein